MNFTELEQKLLRLALDKAAADGEITNSATKFVEQLRKRGAKAEDIIQQPVPARRSAPINYAQTTMPFGKYKGKPIKNIDPNYLEWVLSTCTEAKWSRLRTAIARFLEEVE